MSAIGEVAPEIAEILGVGLDRVGREVATGSAMPQERGGGGEEVHGFCSGDGEGCLGGLPRLKFLLIRVQGAGRAVMQLWTAVVSMRP